MFGAPYTGYLVLGFLVGVLVLMAFDYPVGTLTIGSVVVIIPLLVVGLVPVPHGHHRGSPRSGPTRRPHPAATGDRS